MMEPTSDEKVALIRIKDLLQSGHPRMSDFLEWFSERLIHIYKESPNIDFVHALRRYSKGIKEIENLLNIK